MPTSFDLAYTNDQGLLYFESMSSMMTMIELVA